MVWGTMPQLLQNTGVSITSATATNIFTLCINLVQISTKLVQSCRTRANDPAAGSSLRFESSGSGHAHCIWLFEVFATLMGKCAVQLHVAKVVEETMKKKQQDAK